MKILRFIKYSLLFIGLTVAVAGCGGKRQPSVMRVSNPSDSAVVEFAQGFTIEKHGDVTLLTVSNPWQGAQNVIYQYALCPKGADIPAEYTQYVIIRTPVERVICLSTTHVAMISALGRTASIKALSGAAYVSDTLVRDAVEKGQTVEIGYDSALDYEKIISLNPDVIFAYGVNEGLTGSMARLESLGQKIVFNAEYLEQTALGKAEWLRFMAAFYDCEKQAAEMFAAIRDEYLSLCASVKDREQKPKILSGLPWQGIWYIPGGDTWMASMIADAGGEYIWKDNKSKQSIPVNIENIVNQGGNADIWINTNAAGSLSEIKSVDERLAMLKPVTTGAVYNNNARTGTTGGNDFFESGVVNPHIILKDLISIFYPDLLPDYKQRYYIELK
jgi:iron complex transport system substrate-binding protein